MTDITLSKHDESFIERQLESGRYSSASQVVGDALRLLEQHEEARERWLLDEIPSRYEELRRNPEKAVPYEQARARFEANHSAAMAKAR